MDTATTSFLILSAVVLPALTFRTFINRGTVIRRSFFSNLDTAEVLIALTGLSLIIHILTIIILYVFSNAFTYVEKIFYSAETEIFHFQSLSQYVLNILSDSILLLFYLLISILNGFFFTLIIRGLSKDIRLFREFRYGPFESVYDNVKKPLSTCYVLTNVQVGNEFIIYAGLPVIILLGKKDSVDAVFLATPERYTVYFDSSSSQVKTRFDTMKPISKSDKGSIIQIDKSTILNVHLEVIDMDGLDV